MSAKKPSRARQLDLLSFEATEWFVPAPKAPGAIYLSLYQRLPGFPQGRTMMAELGVSEALELAEALVNAVSRANALAQVMPE